MDKPEVETSLLTLASAAVGRIRPLLGKSIRPDSAQCVLVRCLPLCRAGLPLDQVASPRHHVRGREFDTGRLA